MEQTYLLLEEKMECFWSLPAVLIDRVLKFSALSFCLLIAGIFTGLQTGSAGFVAWSAGLGLFGMLKACRMGTRFLKHQYEMVEGVVIRVQGRHRPGRFYKVTIKEMGGGEINLLLEKGCRVLPGEKYRFYFNSSKTALTGMDDLDGILQVDSFYGLERLKKEGEA